MKSEVEESSAGIRSYQILTLIGSLFTIWDLTSANKMSVDVLAVSIFAIISVFLFKNRPKLIGYGLIALIASYFFIPSGFSVSNLGFLPFEMIIFGAAAVTALRYKTKLIAPSPQ
jgi:hypothetical protein